MAVYKLSGWGQPVGMGATGAFHGQVSAICKKDGPQGQHYVANELVAAELGRILRLPVPPGFVIMDSTTAWFSSLNFNLTGVALPPIIPANFANAFPNETAALLAFDIFIANPDRHANNFSADMTPPAKFNIFDHSHSLLGSIAPPALAQCQNAQNSLVIDASIGGSRHVLLDSVTDDRLFIEPIERIESIPDYFIRSVVSEAAQFGLTNTESQLLEGFLLDRRRKVRHLISSNKPAFRGIAQWSLL